MSTSWTSIARGLLSGLTQLIYPPTCWTCGVLMPTADRAVCAICLPRLTKDPFPTCPRCSSTVGPHLVLDRGCPACKDESFAFDGAFRMAPYDGPLREAILRMKTWNGEDLAEVLGGMWAKIMAPRLAPFRPDAVVPVPLHWMRRLRRGYNANDRLAQALAIELAIPCRRVLRRIRRTPLQTMQPTPTARKENVKHAFEARPTREIEGQTLVLVDDVMTTGSTVSEAARALRTLKPKAIYVAVLAHWR